MLRAFWWKADATCAALTARSYRRKSSRLPLKKPLCVEPLPRWQSVKSAAVGNWNVSNASGTGTALT